MKAHVLFLCALMRFLSWRAAFASFQQQHAFRSSSLQRRCFATTTTSYDEFVQLTQEIRRHDDLYYNQNAATLSDEEYDALVKKEAELCRTFPEFQRRLQEEYGVEATRFGGRVGAATPVTAQKQRHYRKMLSLDNCHSQSELLQWLGRMRKRLLDENATMATILSEPKLDGLSLSLRYENDGNKSSNSTLQWAATRGDGTEGQDVTAATSRTGIPTTLEGAPSLMEVRGEIVLPTSVFDNLVNFSNARNAASGILLRKENRDLQSMLRFYAYDVVSNDESLVVDGVQVRSKLVDWGFQVPEPVQVTILPHETEWNETHVQPMLDYYSDLEKHRRGLTAKLKWDDYEMDGVVHKVSQRDLRTVLGNTNRSPRWAIAHKFPSQTALTFLTGLDVQVGRTGALTPVALLEPVDMSGVTVKRATLHNFAHVAQLFGSTQVPVGTQVLVRRAGDVIPQVVQRVLEDAPTEGKKMISFQAPSHCPACGSPTKMETLKSVDGQVVRCGGPALECPPRAVGALAHAFSRDALDIKGLSEARIEQLMNAGLLRTPADIFKLSQNEIAELPGWGSKSAQNLAGVVRRKANDGISLARFIYSLGIRHAGEHTSKLIASAYGTVDDFLSLLSSLAENDESELAPLVGTNETEGTKGIGPAQVASLRSFAVEKASVEAARELAKAIPVHSEIASRSDANVKPWDGYTVVFTGSLPNKLSRSKAQELARAMGAKSTPATVSKSTTLVVAGEGGGKKLEQAKTLGVRVMNSDEFIKLTQDYIAES